MFAVIVIVADDSKILSCYETITVLKPMPPQVMRCKNNSDLLFSALIF